MKNNELLQKYCSNILKWNKAYNLISASQSESDIWERHITDSLQLYEFISGDNGLVIDLGSGAGFPSIPCAILASENNKNLKFLMIESVSKKALFLEDTIRLLELKNIEAKCDRIENLKNIKANIITARAFSKIDEIFDITKNYMQENTRYILLKGRNVQQEIDQALERYIFDYQLVNSKTGDGFIFIAENVKNK